jgi:hypothetical protein
MQDGPPLVGLLDKQLVKTGRGVHFKGRGGDPKIVRKGFDERPQAVSSLLVAHAISPVCPLPSGARFLAPQLVGRLVVPQPDRDRVTKQPVSRPGEIVNFGDKLRLDPMHTRKNDRRSQPSLARRRTTNGDVLRIGGSRPPTTDHVPNKSVFRKSRLAQRL